MAKKWDGRRGQRAKTPQNMKVHDHCICQNLTIKYLTQMISKFMVVGVSRGLDHRSGTEVWNRLEWGSGLCIEKTKAT